MAKSGQYFNGRHLLVQDLDKLTPAERHQSWQETVAVMTDELTSVKSSYLAENR